MSWQQEVPLDRLVSRYERRFGEPPAPPSTDLDHAIAFVRVAINRPIHPGQPTAALEPAGVDS